MRLSKSQQGIAHLALLLMTLVAVIGFAGWRVYESQKDAKRSYDNATKSDAAINLQKEKKSTEPEYSEKVLTAAEADAKLKELGITFTYPRNWKITYRMYVTEGVEFPSITFDSPDLKRNQGEIAYLLEGGTFTLSISKTEHKNIKSHIAAGHDYYYHESYVTLNGVEASKGSCGHHSIGSCLLIVKEGKMYDLNYFGPNKNLAPDTTSADKYKNEFQVLIDSIKFVN